jgi:hypothetical protein
MNGHTAGKEPAMEVLGFVILVLGLFGSGMLRRHLREAKLLRHRQIIHEERLKAMEHNAPLPEVDDMELASRLREMNSHHHGSLAGAVLWMRIVALCVGLASFFGGIGTTIGMYFVKDPDIHNAWAFGLVPVFIGFGLLVFYVMSKGVAEAVKGGSAV